MVSVLLAATCSIIGAGGPTARPFLTGIGCLSGASYPGSYARAISADGQVVVGSSSVERGSMAIRWTLKDRKLETVGDLPGERVDSRANAVSADGSVIVGWSSSHYGNEAFRWTASEGMKGLGDIKGGYFWSEGLDVSADGTVVVGQGTAPKDREPFRWTQAEGMTSLGGYGKALRVSADGKTIVGERWSSQTGSIESCFRWTAATGQVTVAGIDHPQIHGITPDASQFVGVAKSGADYCPFRFSIPDTLTVLQQTGDDRQFGRANAISADGRLVVGASGGLGKSKAVVWIGEREPVSLEQVLHEWCHVDLAGWELTDATDISADGRVIIGNGKSPDGRYEGYVACIGTIEKLDRR